MSRFQRGSMQPQLRYVLHCFALPWSDAGDKVDAEEATEALPVVHTPDHLAILRRMSDTGGDLDLDSCCSQGSWEAIFRGLAA